MFWLIFQFNELLQKVKKNMHNLWLTVNNYGLNIADLSVVAGFLRLGREQKSKNGICCRPIIISAKEVIFSLCLFICLFVHLFVDYLFVNCF